MPLPTKILPKALFDRVKRTRPVYQIGRKARFAIDSGKAHFDDLVPRTVEADHVESDRCEFVAHCPVVSGHQDVFVYRTLQSSL